MSRFSIRIQVLFFAGAFAIALLVVSAMSWAVQTSLRNSISLSQIVFDELNLMAQISEHLERAEIDVLLFTSGRDSVIGEARHEMELAAEKLGTAAEVFASDTDSHSTGVPEQLNRLETSIRNILPEIETLAGLMLFDRKTHVTGNILPGLEAAIAEIITLKKELADVVHLHAVETGSVVERSYLLMAATIVFSLIGAAVLTFAFGRVLSRPIQSSAEAVTKLAQKDFAAEISGTGRGDEIGVISRNLEDLRDQLERSDRESAQEKAVNARRVELFSELGRHMTGLKNGDLAQSVVPSSWSDLGESYVGLCEDFNALASSLQDLVGALRQSGERVETSAIDLSGMSAEMSRRAEVQAATLEESAAALEELATSVHSAADRAQRADEKVVAGRACAERGGEVMARAQAAMTSIASSSEQITMIIGVIDDIAFQTSLLALNAGVEAARAGDSGKGFAVVASEVRSLAQKASESAHEIKQLVSHSAQQVEDGERLVHETSDTLKEIVDSVNEVSEMVSEIATSAKEQASGVQEINVGVAELDKVTQQNAAMVSETSSASQGLSDEAVRLSGLLSQFTGVAEAQETVADSSDLPDGSDLEEAVPLSNNEAVGDSEEPDKEAMQPNTGQATNDVEYNNPSPGSQDGPKPSDWENDVAVTAPAGFDVPTSKQQASGGEVWKDF